MIFLLNFKQRLLGIGDFFLVIFQEIVQHVDLGLGASLLTLLKEIGGWGHFPTNSVHFVGTFLTIVGHHNSTVKITINVGLIFKSIKAVVNNC